LFFFSGCESWGRREGGRDASDLSDCFELCFKFSLLIITVRINNIKYLIIMNCPAAGGGASFKAMGRLGGWGIKPNALI